MRVLGLNVERGPYTERRSVIGEIEATPSGNIALRVGQEWVNGAGATTSWQQTEHVVLGEDEVDELINELQRVRGGGIGEVV